jgi:hypothetical protein
MMLAVVKIERVFGDMGLKSRALIGKRGEGESHDDFLCLSVRV